MVDIEDKISLIDKMIEDGKQELDELKKDKNLYLTPDKNNTWHSLNTKIEIMVQALEQLRKSKSVVYDENFIYKAYVSEHLDVRDLLEQLAEEAAELSQASLKAIRAYQFSNNPTPVNMDEALKSLKEEAMDVMAAIDILNLGIEVPVNQNTDKWKRWAERLGMEVKEE